MQQLRRMTALQLPLYSPQTPQLDSSISRNLSCWGELRLLTLSHTCLPTCSGPLFHVSGVCSRKSKTSVKTSVLSVSSMREMSRSGCRRMSMRHLLEGLYRSQVVPFSNIQIPPFTVSIISYQEETLTSAQSSRNIFQDKTVESHLVFDPPCLQQSTV